MRNTDKELETAALRRAPIAYISARLGGLVLLGLIGFGGFKLVQFEIARGWDETLPFFLPLALAGIGFLIFLISAFPMGKHLMNRPSLEPDIGALKLAIWLLIAVALTAAIFGAVYLDLATKREAGRWLVLPILVFLPFLTGWAWLGISVYLYHRLKPQDAMGEAAVAGAENVGIDNPAGDERKPSAERE